MPKNFWEQSFLNKTPEKMNFCKKTSDAKYGKTFEKFGGETLPLLIVIDKKGKITYHHTGYRDGDEIKLKEHLQTL